MLGICPELTLVDITHDIPPHDVLDGRAAAGRGLPLLPGRDHLRRGRRSRRRLGAPRHRRRGRRLPVRRARQRRADGRSSARRPAKKIVELTERRYARPTVSRTFEGRDRFAPAAAWLAKGIQLSALGRALADVPAPRHPACPRRRRRRVRGVVLRVDRFGNLVTNIDRRTFERLGAGRARSPSTPAATRDRAARRDLRRHPRRGASARSSAAPITSSSPLNRRAPPSRLGLGRRRALGRRVDEPHPERTLRTDVEPCITSQKRRLHA